MSHDSQLQISTARFTFFFALTFLLATPFYILNALAYRNVLGGPHLGPIYIALFTLTPIASASVLTVRQHGYVGLKQLLWRIFDFKRIGNYRWYGVIILLPLLLSLLSLGGSILVDVQIPNAMLSIAALPVLLLFFFILAAGEETGWMGYAFEPMQAKYGALWASLVLGLVWAIWHVPFFVFMMPDLIVFSTLITSLVGYRVLIAWAYNNAGKSLFAAILMHAIDNTIMFTLPDTSAIGTLGPVIYCSLVLMATIVVVIVWGPRTLARYRFTH